MPYNPGITAETLDEGGATINDGAGHVYSAPAPSIPQTPIAVSGTAGAALINAQTLPGVAGKTTWIRGFTVTTTNPAAAVSGVVTVTGLLAGTLSYEVVEAVATGLLLDIRFPDPLPASAVNTGIVVTLPAITSGAASAVSAYGFQR